jgi:outer membrane protein OmpA-like peptidoglycan-associated protein
MDFYLPEIGVIRINFPTDEYMNPYKYTLDSSGIETGRLWTEELKLVASNIKMALDRIDRIVLVGHTDDVGTDAYNMALGLRRVDFVMNELVKLGIPREVLYSRTAGEGEPIPRNKDEDTTTYRKRLRRVTMEKFFK